MGSLVPVLAILFLSCLAPSLQQGDEEADVFPLTPPIASAKIEENDATCSSVEVQDFVKDTLQPLILSSANTLVPCTPQVKGLVSHCPASNCTDLFNLAQEAGIIRFSNYYWLLVPTGEVRKVYCNRDTQQSEYSSCEEVFEFQNQPQIRSYYTIRPPGGSPETVLYNNEVAEPEYFSCDDIYQNQTDLPSGTYTIRSPEGSPVTVFCNNETGETEYSSCAGIHQFHPDLPSGTYTVRSSGGSPLTVYCDMDIEECGGGGWTRVASIDYNDPNTTCPSSWSQVQFNSLIIGCAIPYRNLGCFSSSFPTQVEFSQVCGKVIGIQSQETDAFIGPDDIDSYYVSGVSITHGSPRQHIWSFAAYPSNNYPDTLHLCPCSNPSLNVPPPPSFVGNNYFCDTAFDRSRYTNGTGPYQTHSWYLDDPVWNGQGCSYPSACCSFNNPPWFSTTLPQRTSDDIEVRICHYHDTLDNTAITQLDLYIK